MTKLNFKINKFLTDVHKYSGSLCIGDAIEIIENLKKDDPYFNYFYDDNKDEFRNNVKKVKKNLQHLKCSL